MIDDDRADEPEPERDPGQRLEDLLAEHRDPAEVEEAPEEFDPFAPIDHPGSAGAGAGEADGDQGDGDVSEEDEAGRLPDAPLFALLRTIEAEVGVDRIDRIWVFPPRRLEAGETSVVVVGAYPDIDSDRRRVYAAHYTATEQAAEPRLALNEYGTAPTDRVGRLVEEVVERIKDGPAGAPRAHDIEGRDERWNAVLHELAEAWLEEAQKNPRLRR